MGERKVTVVAEGREFEVDAQKLADRLSMTNRVAKRQGFRPGEPWNLTRTPTDPISYEKATTLLEIIEEHRKP